MTEPRHDVLSAGRARRLRHGAEGWVLEIDRCSFVEGSLYRPTRVSLRGRASILAHLESTTGSDTVRARIVELLEREPAPGLDVDLDEGGGADEPAASAPVSPGLQARVQELEAEVAELRRELEAMREARAPATDDDPATGDARDAVNGGVDEPTGPPADSPVPMDDLEADGPVPLGDEAAPVSIADAESEASVSASDSAPLEDEAAPVSMADAEGAPPAAEAAEGDSPVAASDAPAVEEDAPAVEEDAPAIEEDAPAVEGDAPAIEEDPSEAGAGSPDAEVDPPEAEADPPEAEADPPPSDDRSVARAETEDEDLR